MLAIGCDHGGFGLKQEILEYLDKQGIPYEDVGCYSTDSCDYPQIAKVVAGGVSSQKYDRGILICGTGIGMSMAANKFKGVRAAVCENEYSAQMTREHNDANILCLGARVLGPAIALRLVDTFLHTEFSGGRHQRRVDMIAELEG